MLTLLCVKGSKRFTFDNFRNRQVVFYDGHHGLWMSGDAEFAEVPE
jgi:hypothetical protein